MNLSRPLNFLTVIFFAVFAISCESSGDDSGTFSGSGSGGSGGTGNSGNWLIPISEVRDGGPGKDGIPALDEPDFLDAGQAFYLDEEDLVIGYKRGNDIRAYSHRVLDWHEIVNDMVDNFPIAITYCPLTGSAIGWGRSFDGKTTTFGVSGLLYNTNLIPYDRSTDSNWSQMRLDCVNGAMIGSKIETFQVIETTWKTWKSMYPMTKVISNLTGFNRNYSVYPYGDYKTNHNNMIFSVSPDDNRISRKDRVMGVIVNDEAKVYEFSKLKSQIVAINDEFNGDMLVVTGSKTMNFMVAYNRTLEDETVLEFVPVPNGGDVIMKDNEGNTWNIFGEAVSGSREGTKLATTSSYIGYWMAWGAFYPDAEIYEFTGNE